MVVVVVISFPISIIAEVVEIIHINTIYTIALDGTYSETGWICTRNRTTIRIVIYPTVAPRPDDWALPVLIRGHAGGAMVHWSQDPLLCRIVKYMSDALAVGDVNGPLNRSSLSQEAFGLH